MMEMMDLSHSAPFSKLTEVDKKNGIFEGYIIFQMAGNDQESWNLDFDINSEGNTHSLSDVLDVNQSERQNVSVFMDEDGQSYTLALIEPTDPGVKRNDAVMGLFKMESMEEFSVVDNFTIKVDPRMLGMGNHSSPNNGDLTQDSDGFYHGKLNFTMSGYWKINMILENENGDVLKGEKVTDKHESSSLFLEVEFSN